MAHEEFKASGGGFVKRESPEATRQAEQKFHLNSAIRNEQSRIKNEGLAGELEALKSQSGGHSESSGFAVAAGKSMEIGGSVALDKLYGKSEPGGIHQILGVSSPSAGTDTNLFTVLGKHTARVSVLWVANRRLIKAKIRVGFDVAGGGTNVVPDAAWLYYNVEVPAESTLVLDAATGFWLGAADDVVVYTDISGVSFGASGSEYATV